MSGKLIALLAVAGLVLYLVFKGKGTTFGTAAQPFHSTALPAPGGMAQGGIANLENTLASTFGNLFRLASASSSGAGPGQTAAQGNQVWQAEAVQGTPGSDVGKPFINQGPATPGDLIPAPPVDIISADNGIVGTNTLAGLGTSWDSAALQPPVFTETLSYNAIEGT